MNGSALDVSASTPRPVELGAFGDRVCLVGGLSSVHDPLCAAALRGAGVLAEALHPRTDEGLRRARALGNHGQCNPAHYAVGAVIEHARRSGLAPAAFAARHAWLTVGSCGPCRLAAFDFEYARVLSSAGLGALPVLLADQLAFAAAPLGLGGQLRTPPAAMSSALLEAVLAADVIAAQGHALRPYARDPGDVDALVARAVDAAAARLAAGEPVTPALEEARARAATLRCDRTRVLPRVLLVGEPWTTLADGDPSYDLARWLAVAGAEVVAPAAADWLLFRLWEERERATEAGSEAALGAALALDHAAAHVRARWHELAMAAGVTARLEDPAAIAAIAAPHYTPAVKGGSGHLEVGRALAAARDHGAHLVLSLKPFGCLPSSALSDGILSILARSGESGLGATRFLALETTGDADAIVESRVVMALHAAALAAADELDTCARSLGLSLAGAMDAIAALPAAMLDIEGSRTYACTAVEGLWRARPRAGGL
jgi:predicted nucleotide-binding protein (sugar kinase/HSP70/actin superfamily)